MLQCSVRAFHFKGSNEKIRSFLRFNVQPYEWGDLYRIQGQCKRIEQVQEFNLTKLFSKIRSPNTDTDKSH